jgi:hypothetical protein
MTPERGRIEKGRPSRNGDSVDPPFSDGDVMAQVPITTLGRHK